MTSKLNIEPFIDLEFNQSIFMLIVVLYQHSHLSQFSQDLVKVLLCILLLMFYGE
jgi:hypothetical protein